MTLHRFFCSFPFRNMAAVFLFTCPARRFLPPLQPSLTFTTICVISRLKLQPTTASNYQIIFKTPTPPSLPTSDSHRVFFICVTEPSAGYSTEDDRTFVDNVQRSIILYWSCPYVIGTSPEPRDFLPKEPACAGSCTYYSYLHHLEHTSTLREGPLAIRPKAYYRSVCLTVVVH